MRCRGFSRWFRRLWPKRHPQTTSNAVNEPKCAKCGGRGLVRPPLPWANDESTSRHTSAVSPCPRCRPDEIVHRPHHHYAPIVVNGVSIHGDRPCTSNECPQWVIDLWPADVDQTKQIER